MHSTQKQKKNKSKTNTHKERSLYFCANFRSELRSDSVDHNYTIKIIKTQPADKLGTLFDCVCARNVKYLCTRSFLSYCIKYLTFFSRKLHRPRDARVRERHSAGRIIHQKGAQNRDLTSKRVATLTVGALHCQSAGLMGRSRAPGG